MIDHFTVLIKSSDKFKSTSDFHHCGSIEVKVWIYLLTKNLIMMSIWHSFSFTFHADIIRMGKHSREVFINKLCQGKLVTQSNTRKLFIDVFRYAKRFISSKGGIRLINQNWSKLIYLDQLLCFYFQHQRAMIP